jgi:hypothetical protein
MKFKTMHKKLKSFPAEPQRQPEQRQSTFPASGFPALFPAQSPSNTRRHL